MAAGKEELHIANMSQPRKDSHYLAFMGRRLVKQAFYADGEIILLSTTEIYPRPL